MNEEIKTCPMCLMDYKEYPALSKHDNKTLICIACDQRQTIIDYNSDKLGVTPYSIIREDKYKKGFNLLMEYWNCIPEDEREKLDKELMRLGL